MDIKDRIMISGVIILILLNVLIIALQISETTPETQPQVTGAALLIQENLVNDPDLMKCCSAGSGEGCYVLKESDCAACADICPSI